MAFRSAFLLTIASLTLAGCMGMRPPGTLHSAGSSDALTTGWDRQFSIRLGPRMLHGALPLLLAHRSSHLPLYLRHLDVLSLHLYQRDDEAASDSPAAAPLPSWDVVLCLRDDTSTIRLLRPPESDTLNRFYLVLDDGDERIVAYAQGRLLPFLRLALAANT